jgi:hypothetical protein
VKPFCLRAEKRIKEKRTALREFRMACLCSFYLYNGAQIMRCERTSKTIAGLHTTLQYFVPRSATIGRPLSSFGTSLYPSNIIFMRTNRCDPKSTCVQGVASSSAYKLYMCTSKVLLPLLPHGRIYDTY